MFRFNPLLRNYSLSSFARFSYRSFGKDQVFRRLQSSNTTPPKKQMDLKTLMKEYGFSALGVYLAISAIDLPLCYILVHSMGEEEIGYYENKVKQYFGYGLSDEELKKKNEISKIEREMESKENKDPESDSSSSIISTITSKFSWTEFAIAYGIHKSLIFIRVPIVASITPSIVKALRRWGFKIGTDKVAKSASIAKENIKDFTASNSKFGTKPRSKQKWFSWFF